MHVDTGADDSGAVGSPSMFSSTDGLHRSASPPDQSRNCSLPTTLDALELREYKRTIGLYGIGMKINTAVPHTVIQVLIQTVA